MPVPIRSRYAKALLVWLTALTLSDEARAADPVIPECIQGTQISLDWDGVTWPDGATSGSYSVGFNTFDITFTTSGTFISSTPRVADQHTNKAGSYGNGGELFVWTSSNAGSMGIDIDTSIETQMFMSIYDMDGGEQTTITALDAGGNPVPVHVEAVDPANTGLTITGSGTTSVFIDSAGGSNTSGNDHHFNVYTLAPAETMVFSGSAVVDDWYFGVSDVSLCDGVFDRPDGPASYGADATHLLDSTLYMGTGVDGDTAATFAGFDASGTGDDTDGIDDEDGAAIPALTQGASATIPVTVAQGSGNEGYLQAWIDWNGDGTYSAGERIATDLQSASAGSSVVNIPVTVPANATTAQTFARFRWSRQAGLDATEWAFSGEVEDYAVTIGGGSALVVNGLCTFTPGGLRFVGGAQGNVAAGLLPFATGDTTRLYTDVGGLGIDMRLSLWEDATRTTPVPLNYTYTFSGINRLNGDEWHAVFEFFETGTSTPAYVSGLDLVMEDFEYFNDASRERIENLRIETQSGAQNLLFGTDIPIEMAPDGTLRLDNGGATLYAPYDTGGAGPNPGLWARMSPAPGTPYRELSFDVGADGSPNPVLALCTPLGERNPDRSDAPASYGSVHHTQFGKVQLGASVDSDGSALDSAAADADGADDDGVTFPFLARGESVTIPVAVEGAGGYLQAWIDWNTDGDFADAGERIATDLQDGGAGDTDAAPGTLAFAASVPSSAATGQTFARFRWSTDAGLGIADPAPDGEVEDYAVTISPALVRSTGDIQFADTGTGIHRCNLGYLTWGGTSFADGVDAGDQVSFFGPGGSSVTVTATSASIVNKSFYGIHGGDGGWGGSPFHQGYDVSAANDLSLVYDSLSGTGMAVFDFDLAVVQGTLETMPQLALIDIEATDTVGGGEVLTLYTNGTPWTIQETIGTPGSGVWTGAGTDTFVIDESITESPLLLSTGATKAQVRLDTDSGGRAGFAIAYFYGCDQSDAPASYGRSDHLALTDVTLGTGIDSELPPLASTDASGDGADDDGAAIPTAIEQGETLTVPVTLQGPGFLSAWIDWNGDGAFGAGEAVVSDVTDNGAGDADPVAGSISFDVTAPAGATPGPTFARLRWSTAAGLGATGATPGGEVEDYAVTVQAPGGGGYPALHPTGPGDGGLCLLTHHQNSGVAADPNSFYTITDHTNPSTLTKIGPWDVPGGTVEGLTADVANGVFYALNANRGGGLYLGEIDPATGSFSDITTVGTGSLSHSVYGTLSIHQSRALAHRPGTSEMWVAAYNTQPPNGPGGTHAYLFKMNATTGAVMTGAFGGEDYIAIDLAPYRLDNTGERATVEALVFHRGDPDTLYGVVSSLTNGASPQVGHLFAVDLSPATPIAYLAPRNLDGVTISGGTAPASSIIDIEGMSFDENDDLIVVSSNFGTNSLYIVDPATGEAGAATALFSGDWEGLVCDPVYGGAPSDYSDAPIGSYGEATHIVVPGMRLGAAIDSEPASIANADASGDGSDDDGVSFPALRQGGTATLAVSVTGTGYLQGWIDWNGNGAFDAIEQIAADVQDADGDGSIALPVSVPADAALGTTFARFRWSGDAAIGTTGEAPDGEVEDYAVTVAAPGGAQLSGRLFLDTGTGGATAHDGVPGGTEPTSAQATIVLLDGTGTPLATATVNPDGTWSATLPPGYTGPVQVVVAAAPGLRPISANTTGLPGLSDPDAADGAYTFTASAGSTYDTLDIGLVPEPTLDQNRTASIQPGQVLSLPHTYTATTAGTVSFALSDIAGAPVGGFSPALFIDDDCDGVPDRAMPASLTVAAGDRLCPVVRVQAAAGLPPSAQLSYTLNAITAFTGTSATHAASNVDTVTATAGEMVLRKSVRNVTQGGAEGVANSGEIGDVIRYRLTITNPGSDPVVNVTITDRTPPFTALAAPVASPVTVVTGLSCTLVTPAASATGYEGPLLWTCPGTLPPGAEGSVTFDVRISP